MRKLFRTDLVYPCDNVGAYVEVRGPIVEVGDIVLSDGSVEVTVETEHGRISGWADKLYVPSLSTDRWATVRVYDAGGGFYPDNDVMAVSGRP